MGKRKQDDDNLYNTVLTENGGKEQLIECAANVIKETPSVKRKNKFVEEDKGSIYKNDYNISKNHIYNGTNEKEKLSRKKQFDGIPPKCCATYEREWLEIKY